LKNESTDSGTGKIKISSQLGVFFKPYKFRMLLAFVVLMIAAGSTLFLSLGRR
jgi:hypothetical protein